MLMKTFHKLIIASVLILFASGTGIVFCEKAKIAMLSVDNGSKDPRYDYLEGLLSGLILYDLSDIEDITIVERSSLENIMKEQELIMSDIGESKAFQIGKVLGADYLLKASFVFLGTDIVLNATVMDVATSKSFVISDRGSTENLAHAVSEKIILKLTGRDV
jgi:TolB-like protein